jgi:hypothetical protein
LIIFFAGVTTKNLSNGRSFWQQRRGNWSARVLFTCGYFGHESASIAKTPP